MSHPKHYNQVRIIGGTHRGRKIAFPVADGLRPTPDSVREKLFNWLGQDLTGQTVLDLFAGSGALGFESASRGAAKVVMVEADRQTAQNLTRHAAQFGWNGTTVSVFCRSAAAFLHGCAETFRYRFPRSAVCMAAVAGFVRRAGRPSENRRARLYRSGASARVARRLAILREGRSGQGRHLWPPAAQNSRINDNYLLNI